MEQHYLPSTNTSMISSCMGTHQYCSMQISPIQSSLVTDDKGTRLSNHYQQLGLSSKLLMIILMITRLGVYFHQPGLLYTSTEHPPPSLICGWKPISLKALAENETLVWLECSPWSRLRNKKIDWSGKRRGHMTAVHLRDVVLVQDRKHKTKQERRNKKSTKEWWAHKNVMSTLERPFYRTSQPFRPSPS